MKNSKITMLCECAIMVALAFALSWAKIWTMPMGGSITMASMLPIMLIGMKYGPLVGVGTGSVYSMTQVAQALAEGNVFPYCETFGALILCLLLDYIIPFTVLGLTGIFKSTRLIKNDELAFYAGMGSAVAVRFISHFVVGVVIWGQWAPEGMGKFLYSFLYQATFLPLDFAICIICAVLMMRKSEIRKLICISTKKAVHNTEK